MIVDIKEIKAQRTIMVGFFIVGLVLITSPLLLWSKNSYQPSSAIKTINVNTASLAQLVHLPGIGRHRAMKIIAYRQNRPFRRPIDIMRIKGIGRKIYRQIVPFINTQPPPLIRSQVIAPKK